MSAIAHYLEASGIATTGISLVRENTEALEPPRFLWVSFPLGRPLGVPGDAVFQHRVIRAALALLDEPHGPVLEDYDRDAPDGPGGLAETGAVCPVSFADASTGGAWSARLCAELALLQPWHDAACERRGRSTVGLTGRSPRTLAADLGALLDEPDLEATLARLGLEPRGLKALLEDLKAYYQEAMAARPDRLPWTEVRRVLWRESALGAAMLQLQARCEASHHGPVRDLAPILVPRWATAHESSA